MMIRINRPTLAVLWRVLLSRLECHGAGDAPAVARSLAIAALMGRPAEASGIRVEREGDAVLVVGPEPMRPAARPAHPGRKLLCALSS